jgi:hypothetical protein
VLVPEMHAVVGADRRDTPVVTRPQVMKTANQFHHSFRPGCRGY